MSATTQLDEVQERVLSNVETAQTRVLELNQNMVDAVERRVPTDRLRLPSLPGLSELPDPTELVDSYFDFTAKLAKANRAFYKEMIAIWTPDGVEPTEPAKATEKAAGKKATTKKATGKKATTKK